MKRFGKLAIEIIGLQSARGRLVFFCVASCLIFLVPYASLSNLSLWQRLGLDWAPSIGLTRAYWLLLHMDFQAAWQRNPFIYAVILIGLPILMRDTLSLIRHKIAISSSSASAEQ